MADYDSAEAQLRESPRNLLIFYRGGATAADESVQAALREDAVDVLTSSYVRCMLFKAYEPDRRYVAQYGVKRAPALIVVHRDGTYHAREGVMDAEEVKDFLVQARPPGRPARINPHIPRRTRYVWHDSLDEAQTVAEQSERPMCVVVYRRLSRDWPRLKKILTRHEVYSRLGGMVHCRLAVLSAASGPHDTPFGQLNLPVMVIVRPDGPPEVLELPMSYESVVRFIDAVAQRTDPSASRAALSSFQVIGREHP